MSNLIDWRLELLLAERRSTRRTGQVIRQHWADILVLASAPWVLVGWLIAIAH